MVGTYSHLTPFFLLWILSACFLSTIFQKLGTLIMSTYTLGSAGCYKNYIWYMNLGHSVQGHYPRIIIIKFLVPIYSSRILQYQRYNCFWIKEAVVLFTKVVCHITHCYTWIIFIWRHCLCIWRPWCGGHWHFRFIHPNRCWRKVFHHKT